MTAVPSKSSLTNLREVVAANPNSAKAHMKLGLALAKVGLLKEAEIECRHAVDLEPQNAKAWVNLGGILLSAWDFNGCIEANQKALECQPDLLEAYYNQGLGHLYLKDTEQMVACFEKVLQLDSQHPGGTYHLAIGMLALGQVTKARFYVDRAAKLGYQPQPDFLNALDKEERKNNGSAYSIEIEPDPKNESKN